MSTIKENNEPSQEPMWIGNARLSIESNGEKPSEGLEMIWGHITQEKLSIVEVRKKFVEETSLRGDYVLKLLTGQRILFRDPLLRFAKALEFDFHETEELLNAAGFGQTPSTHQCDNGMPTN